MDSLRKVTEIAELASGIILASGGETSRAEETAVSIGRAFGCDVDIIALPTGLTMTVSRDDASLSVISRVRRQSVDLEKLDGANAVSRALCDGTMTPDEAYGRLLVIKKERQTSAVMHALFAGGSAALFALMFGGGWFEFIVAGTVTMIVQAVLRWIPDRDSMTLGYLVSGFLSAALALAAFTVKGGGNVGLCIWSIMMPYLPGLAFTNGIRDSMRGDMVSGGARLTDALMRSVVLACGAGVAIGCYLQLGGAASWLISLA